MAVSEMNAAPKNFLGCRTDNQSEQLQPIPLKWLTNAIALCFAIHTKTGIPKLRFTPGARSPNDSTEAISSPWNLREN
jgi:hypothetical protein